MAKILIIDDDVAVITLIKALLQHSGHEVFALTNPNDVPHFLEMHEVDAVLCDLIMPEMSGWEVYEFLRRQPATLELPVLFVSGTTDVAHKVRGIRSRYCDFINKPFEPPELLARLEKLINSTVTDQDLHGDFSTFSFEELTQSLEQNAKTGILDVVTDRAKGHLSFCKGAITEAVFDGFEGRGAFMAMVTLDRGYFWFRIQNVTTQSQALSVQSMIMESVYWRDELERLPFTAGLDQRIHWNAPDSDLPKELQSPRALEVVGYMRNNPGVQVRDLFEQKIMAPLELKFTLAHLLSAKLASTV